MSCSPSAGGECLHDWVAELGCWVQGCKAVICMPVTTPEIKIEAVRRLGGHVKLVGETYSETQTFAQVRVYTAFALQHALQHA